MSENTERGLAPSTVIQVPVKRFPLRHTHMPPDYREVSVVSPTRIYTPGGWRALVKVRNLPVAVYDHNGDLKGVVSRTAYPRTPMGPWAVFAFKYHGKGYTSLLDAIYGYAQCVVKLGPDGRLGDLFKDVSLSHGTMVEDHVFDRVKSLLPRHMRGEFSKATPGSEERAYILWERAFEYLNSIAPSGYYFGSHPGNGSDYGFWKIEEEVEE